MPNLKVSERRPLLFRLFDARFQHRAGLSSYNVWERLEETVQADLGLPLLIASDVRSDPRDEISQPFARMVSIRRSSPA